MRPGTVGRKIAVEDVISRSARILAQNPVLILLSLIPTLPFLVTGLLVGQIPTYGVVDILQYILTVVLSTLVAGTYPFIVKEILAGQRFSITEAVRKSVRRFWSIFVATILVGLAVGLGMVAFVVPGVILATWYAYSIPAIMLEDKGALEGMSASKAFGRDKKSSTFLILLAVGLIGVCLFVVYFLVLLYSASAATPVLRLLDVPLTAWIIIIESYTYLTYGPLSVPAIPEAAALGTPNPAWSPLPSAPGMAAGAPGGFCLYCGSLLEKGSKFCPNCGKPVWWT